MVPLGGSGGLGASQPAAATAGFNYIDPAVPWDVKTLATDRHHVIDPSVAESLQSIDSSPLFPQLSSLPINRIDKITSGWSLTTTFT